MGEFLLQQGTQVAFATGGVQFPTQQQATQYNTMMSNLVGKQQTLLQAQKVAQGDFSN